MVEETQDRIDPLDIFAGSKIREARKLKGVSQSALGDAIGVSFQQIQKYERGSNRVSYSMLVRIAKFLNVTPDWFFQGLPDMLTYSNEDIGYQAWFASPTGQHWMKLGWKLPSYIVPALIGIIETIVRGPA